MKRCKTCYFFDKHPSKGWGDCDNEEVFHDGSSDWEEETPDTALFEYSDVEGYGASFQVHEKFGCVAHKSCWFRRLFSKRRTKSESQTPYEELDEVEPTAEDLMKIKRAQALLKDWSEKNVAEAEKQEKEISKKT